MQQIPYIIVDYLVWVLSGLFSFSTNDVFSFEIMWKGAILPLKWPPCNPNLSLASLIQWQSKFLRIQIFTRPLIVWFQDHVILALKEWGETEDVYTPSEEDDPFLVVHPNFVIEWTWNIKGTHYPHWMLPAVKIKFNT